MKFAFFIHFCENFFILFDDWVSRGGHLQFMWLGRLTFLLRSVSSPILSSACWNFAFANWFSRSLCFKTLSMCLKLLFFNGMTNDPMAGKFFKFKRTHLLPNFVLLKKGLEFRCKLHVFLNERVVAFRIRVDLLVYLVDCRLKRKSNVLVKWKSTLWWFRGLWSAKNWVRQ